MRKNCVKTVCCGGIHVRYYLLTGTNSGNRWYGISVEAEGERTTVTGITPSYCQIQELLRLMINGRVTPVTARDIAEDWLLR